MFEGAKEGDREEPVTRRYIMQWEEKAHPNEAGEEEEENKEEAKWKEKRGSLVHVEYKSGSRVGNAGTAVA